MTEFTLLIGYLESKIKEFLELIHNSSENQIQYSTAEKQQIFNKCDKDGDQQLNLKEYLWCYNDLGFDIVSQ